MTPRSRVLFVDDEPLMLKSIKRVVTGTLDWDLDLATCGDAALKELEQNPVDVIVSDMHMPGMDGATLLRTVQERHPDTVRIVLSGHTDPKLVYRAVPVAHQFLAKPFEPRLLVAALERALALRALLKNPELRQVVVGENRLPAAPATYMRLTRLLSRSPSSLGAVADLISEDVNLSARVAQLASANFGAPRGVSSLLGYVTYLGVDIIKILVLAVEVVGTFQDGAHLPGFAIDDLQRHALSTALLARELVGRTEADDAFLAGMLHDVGKLVLASRATESFRRCLERQARDGGGLCLAERQEIGEDHAAVGAYLLGLWGLPQHIVEAVAAHHAPKPTGSGIGVEGAIYLANLLAKDPAVPIAPTPNDPTAAIDASYLQRTGLSDQLESWRRAARRIKKRADA